MRKILQTPQLVREGARRTYIMRDRTQTDGLPLMCCEEKGET
jgi:hypothetical protein